MPTLPSNTPIWVVVISILVSGGMLGYVRDWVKDHRVITRTPKLVRDQIAANTATDSSITVLARARDELAEDNERLRRTLGEERKNAGELRAILYREREDHARERSDWEAREQRYLARIEALERRVNELLDDIHRLRADVQRGDG